MQKKINENIDIFKTLSCYRQSFRSIFYSPSNDSGSKFIYEFWKRCLITQPMNNWSNKKSDFYEQLIFCADEYESIRDKYMEIVDKLAKEVASYFEDPQDNL